MKTVQRNINDLKENQSNPRFIEDWKFEKLKKSISDFPKMLELRELVIDKNNIVLGGNMRLRAMKALGFKTVTCKIADTLSKAEQHEFMVKDNTNFGEWDWPVLHSEWDIPMLEEWGLDIPPMAADPAEDDAFEIPAEVETHIKLGDVFQIGNHRLMCGDSTQKQMVGKLLGGKSPELMITDPPYGVKYDPLWRAPHNHKGFGAKIKAKGKVDNDDRVDWTEAWKLSPSTVVYIWHGGKHAGQVADNLQKAEFEIRSQIIWVKPSLTFSRGDYHWQHEPCWYAIKKGSKANWIGDRKQTTTWMIAGVNPAGRSNDKNDKVIGHGTQKPIECMAKPIRNHKGDVYDPFGGSGTTMIACEQLKRSCYMMEINPQYCQIIIDRIMKFNPEIVVKQLKYGTKFLI